MEILSTNKYKMKIHNVGFLIDNEFRPYFPSEAGDFYRLRFNVYKGILFCQIIVNSETGETRIEVVSEGGLPYPPFTIPDERWLYSKDFVRSIERKINIVTKKLNIYKKRKGGGRTNDDLQDGRSCRRKRKNV